MYNGFTIMKGVSARSRRGQPNKRHENKPPAAATAADPRIIQNFRFVLAAIGGAPKPNTTRSSAGAPNYQTPTRTAQNCCFVSTPQPLDGAPFCHGEGRRGAVSSGIISLRGGGGGGGLVYAGGVPTFSYFSLTFSTRIPLLLTNGSGATSEKATSELLNGSRSDFGGSGNVPRFGVQF